MAHTLVSNVVHLIWGTKIRGSLIREDLQPAMWSYISGIGKHNGIKTIAVNGMADHCHALIVLPPTMAMSKAMQLLKGGSSKWFREKHDDRFNWQRGFAGYSVSASGQDRVVSYIRNQKAHHKKRDFKTEYIEFLEKHGVEYDPRYVFD
jgi:putative transposase